MSCHARIFHLKNIFVYGFVCGVDRTEKTIVREVIFIYYCRLIIIIHNKSAKGQIELVLMQKEQCYEENLTSTSTLYADDRIIIGNNLQS
ncbi:hypothetical protein evm_008865 [Chilo suppressalis]|nr:hypothetical protein evm_008865 [Chilo suppressalis]